MIKSLFRRFFGRMEYMNKGPYVGVGALIIKDGKVLYGKRKDDHGKGSWCFPGGHLEFNESIEECAKRETLEEVGIRIKNIRLGPFTNDMFKEEGKHYVTLFVIADYDYGEVKLMEPEKSEEWRWFDWNNPPQPLFLPNQNLRKQEFNPFKY